MDNLLFKTYRPHPLLQPFIGSIFVLETKTGLPKSEFSMIAPNCQIKLIIPYKNNMRSTIGGVKREHQRSLLLRHWADYAAEREIRGFIQEDPAIQAGLMNTEFYQMQAVEPQK